MLLGNNPATPEVVPARHRQVAGPGHTPVPTQGGDTR
jgi:hypothetical protein